MDRHIRKSSIENMEYRFGSGSSQTSQTSGDFCRICHENDNINPLLTPCYCSGSLKYVHQQCLQQWLTCSQTNSCELCKFPFIMQSKIKPFNEWRSLDMSGVERRRLFCAVLFHVAAALCVIWSLCVLIERAADEVKRGQIGWPFWTKLVVVTVGLTGGIVFMYIQCKQYLNLCTRWRARNRILLIQNAPEKVAMHLAHSPINLNTQQSTGNATTMLRRNNSSILVITAPLNNIVEHQQQLDYGYNYNSSQQQQQQQSQIIANIENNSINYELDDDISQISFKHHLRHEEGNSSRGSLHNVYDNTSVSTTNTSAKNVDNDSNFMKMVPGGLAEVAETDDDERKRSQQNFSSVFIENRDILNDKNYPKLFYRHSTVVLPTTARTSRSIDEMESIEHQIDVGKRRYSDTKLLNNFHFENEFLTTRQVPMLENILGSPLKHCNTDSKSDEANFNDLLFVKILKNVKMSDVGHEHPGISDEMANEQEIRRRNINSNSKGSIEDLNKSNDSENLINDYNTTDLQSASDSGGEKQGRGSGNDSDPADNIDSEEEKSPEDKYVKELSKNLPQGTDKTPEVLDSALKGLSDKWRNWTIRGIFTFIMISGFILMIYGGPLALMVTTLAVQVKCFQEIISIGYQVYRIHGLPWFRSLSWYFLLTSNYFFYGENLFDYFGVLFNRVDTLRFLITYHRFLSFCFYCIGFVWFVLSLVKKYYMKQFSLFAWTHVALLIVVTQSYLIIQNIFEGMIWFIVPVMMIVCNDVMAYMFGFFFGKTPLIKLSPKKTWEGFIGGGFATVAFGVLFSYILCQYQYFVCPIAYSETEGRITLDCEPSYLFRPQEYGIRIGKVEKVLTMYPFLLHSFSLSLFSSIIGPFGGFFASGFKRAFKIKDFGDMIPGHGGIMDRFDCQFLMATFVNVYISSFIRTASPQKLLAQVYNLKPEQQLQLYHQLKEALENRNILQLN
ncbi:unnamed protein product [Diamesa tonsa]